MIRIQNIQSILNNTSQYIKLEVEKLHDKQIGIINLNSQKDLNSLSVQMMAEISSAWEDLDQDPQIKVIVMLSKVDKAFCAGANIPEFTDKTYQSSLRKFPFKTIYDSAKSVRKPIVCGCNGVSLGGGLELALFSDIIICSEEARFGLPELKLGLIPGIGGTQALAKLIGRTNAMRYILTSENFNAQQALVHQLINYMMKNMGLVSQVVKKDQLREETIKIALKIAEKSQNILILAKDVISKADELGLTQGTLYERAIFNSLFDMKAAKEGISAFLEKRQADFSKV